MDWDEMSSLYRKPPKDARRFQRIFFRNQPIRNKKGLWQPCLYTDRDEISNLYRGPSIDASYQVSVHLAMRFQRRRFKKIVNQKQELPVEAMFLNGSGQNDQSLQRTFHRCFLPNFSKYGKVVSEEKIFQKSTNQKQEWPVVAIFANGLEVNEQSL